MERIEISNKIEIKVDDLQVSEESVQVTIKEEFKMKKFETWNKSKLKSCKDKPKKKPLIHFLNFPIDDSVFVNAYNQLVHELNGNGELNLHPCLFQNHKKLHMTICVLPLENEEKVEKVKAVLKNVSLEIKKIVDSKLYFNFEKFEKLGSLHKTRVIYGKMIEDIHYQKIKDIVHIIIDNLVNNNIIEEKDLRSLSIEKDKHSGRYTNLTHMTLLNVKFLNRKKGKNEFGFNSEKFFNFTNNIILPSAEINKIYFNKMTGTKEGTYELVEYYELK